jgi:hypothetical protein
MPNTETAALAAENAQLKAKNEQLCATIDRLCNSLDTFIRDSTDPGSEALAAVWCARRELDGRPLQ